MSARRFLISLGLVLIVSACAETPSAPPAMEQGPRFLNWATSTEPQFAFEGADLVGSRYARVVVPTPPVVEQSSSAAIDGSSLSWSHTVGTAANRLLIVPVSIRDARKTVAAVSYRGTPLRYLGAQNNDDNSARVEQWYLIAPQSGTGTVTVTMSAKVKFAAGAMSFSGVDQVSPFSGFVSVGGTNESTNPAVAASSGASELVAAVVSLEGDAGTLTPAVGQTQRYVRFTGTSGGEALGVASTSTGTAGLVMRWTTAKAARWAVGAAVIKPAPSIALTQYQATIWAKRGQARTLQINYAANGGTSPFMKLTISDPTYVPGRGNIAMGDSVLVTATVDPNALTVSLEPHQMQFGTASQLELWYGGAGGDLNGDGQVNDSDSYIETQLLGMWYQADPTSPWTTIPATQSLSTKSFTAALQHFSGYSVAW